ncbi:transcription antitermination factor NusB [Stieleria mannarensis]|uniref:transcription antitermination factor NusB n=1 Tax=Stieleria mannarensis TaxID=2755585 RepID=UPI00160039F4|nr:transcription antitermination factor NusB [Rhodopirellula sp. JC639]
MSTRRRAREIVLQLLYEADLNGTRDAISARRFIKSRLQGRSALTAFAEKLLAGTLEHRQEVDRHLGRLAKGWALGRMAVTDRNVMRMAAYEILFSETPGRVAVNEAVVLIKRYGDKNSPRFVNGILDRLLKEHESNSLGVAEKDDAGQDDNG